MVSYPTLTNTLISGSNNQERETIGKNKADAWRAQFERQQITHSQPPSSYNNHRSNLADQLPNEFHSPAHSVSTPIDKNTTPTQLGYRNTTATLSQSSTVAVYPVHSTNLQASSAQNILPMPINSGYESDHHMLMSQYQTAMPSELISFFEQQYKDKWPLKNILAFQDDDGLHIWLRDNHLDTDEKLTQLAQEILKFAQQQNTPLASITVNGRMVYQN